MTPADRITLRLIEAELIEAMLAQAGLADGVHLIRARASGLRDALHELPEAPAPRELPAAGIGGIGGIGPADAPPPPPAPAAPAEPAPAVPAPAPAAAADAAPRRPGMRPGQPTQIYTAERLAYIRAQWPKPDLTTEQIREALNAMPGPPIVSVGALIAKTKTLDDLPPRPHWTQRIPPAERREMALKISEGARLAQKARAEALISDERDALIRATWADLTVTVPQIAERATALPPGREVDASWVWRRAQMLGLPSSRHAASAGAGATGSRAAPGSTATPEREALIRQHWGDVAMTAAELLARYNALPGPPLRTPEALYMAAKRLGLPGSRVALADATAEAASQASAPPEPTAPAAAPDGPGAQAAPPEPPRLPLVTPSPHVPEDAWRADPLGTLTEEELADAREVILVREAGARVLAEETDFPLLRCQLIANALRKAAKADAA